jgi:hypothetical protein
MEFLLSRYSGEEMAVNAAIARGIWSRRNQVVLGVNFSHPHFIIKEAEEVCSCSISGNLMRKWKMAVFLSLLRHA